MTDPDSKPAPTQFGQLLDVLARLPSEAVVTEMRFATPLPYGRFDAVAGDREARRTGRATIVIEYPVWSTHERMTVAEYREQMAQLAAKEQR
jgi:hypothetical protein